jgi:hypothetical protein
LGIIFLLSALLKLIDFNSTVELFADMLGFEIILIRIFLMFLILVELIIAYLIIEDYVKNKYIFFTIGGMIAAFILVNFFFLVKGYNNCGCFGKLVNSSPLLSVIKNVILLYGLFYLWKNAATNDKITAVKGIPK